jgi:hypothetical protein
MKRFMWICKSGDKPTVSISEKRCYELDNERGYYDVMFYWFLKNSKRGDEWQNGTEKFICMKD